MVKTNYYFLVLDIETSTLKNDKGDPVATWLSYGFINLYEKNGDRIETNYFRTWDEYKSILNRISQRFAGRTLLCFVHNLGYEFDYLIKNVSLPTKMLTNSTHAVISATLEDFPQIEYRCTLRLTMKSLAELGNLVGLKKLDDDYSMILPSDEIPLKRKQYCCRDCDIVARYISIHAIKEYGTLSNLPLTKTGRVRKIYNKHYDEYVKEIGCKPIWDLMPNEDCYQAELDAFAGGCVMSNPLFTGIILKNVYSFDITSSYPFAQLSEEYPYTIEREYNPNISMLKEKFWIAKIKFKNIKSKYNWQWLSVSKMNDYDKFTSIYFNGKLVSSSNIIRTITNVDYDIICKTYDFDDIEILEFYHMFEYGELPKPYIETIKECALAKYEWKEISKNTPKTANNYFDVQTQYMLAKGDFNSIYGMSVQKIIQKEYEIDEVFNWNEKRIEYKRDPKKHLRRNFLFGVFVTAYARRNIIYAIIKNCPDTFVYCDTDSIKFIGYEGHFINTNKTLDERYRCIRSLAQIGEFDSDGVYSEFITYGAKKYAYKIAQDDNLYLTVAGLPKFRFKNGMEIIYKGIQLHEFNRIDLFRCGTLFQNCKLGKKYLTSQCTYDRDDFLNISNYEELDVETIKFLNDNNIHTGGGVALYNTSYLLDMTLNDKMYIKDQRRFLSIWLNQYKLNNGIDLTVYVDMTSPIELYLGSGQTEKLIASRKGL